MSQDNQFNLVKAEFELTQRQMDKYDNLSAKVKTWTATLWAALLGWSFQVNQKEVLLLSILIVLIFWCLDAVNKSFRQDYKARRDKIVQALKTFFSTNSWPKDFFAPDLPSHDHRNVKTLKGLLRPHISLLYVPLIIVSLIIFFIT